LRRGALGVLKSPRSRNHSRKGKRAAVGEKKLDINRGRGKPRVPQRREKLTHTLRKKESTAKKAIKSRRGGASG